MTTDRQLDRLVDEVLDDQELTVDSYAGQRIDEQIKNDPTMRALIDAARQVDHRQSAITSSVGFDESPRTDLKDARRTCEETARTLADHIVEDVCRTTIGGHSVDLRHATRLDCPACDEDDVEAFYLGARKDDDGPVTGWVCGYCETDLEMGRREQGGDGVHVVGEGST